MRDLPHATRSLLRPSTGPLSWRPSHGCRSLGARGARRADRPSRSSGARAVRLPRATIGLQHGLRAPTESRTWRHWSRVHVKTRRLSEPYPFPAGRLPHGFARVSPHLGSKAKVLALRDDIARLPSSAIPQKGHGHLRTLECVL